MDSLQWKTEWFIRGLDLAFWILRDERLAWIVAKQAWTRRERFERNQFERDLYASQEEAAGRGVRRYKPVLSLEQMFQFSVFFTSEQYEREQEQTGVNLGQEDFVVRYVKHLVHSALKFNSFHAAVGIGQLLFDYDTRTVRESIYHAVDRDGFATKENDHCRLKKKKLMDMLLARFGDRLEVVERDKRRRAFRSAIDSDRFSAIVYASLQRFAPWGAACGFCDQSRFLSEIKQLCKRTNTPAPVSFEEAFDVFGGAHDENGRCHLLIQPECFMSLADRLRLSSPWERLAVPQFKLTNGHPGGPHPSGKREAPPRWDMAEVTKTLDGLSDETEAAQKIIPRRVSVFVDGVAYGTIDFGRRRRLRITLPESVRILEIKDCDSMALLAAHFFVSIGAEDAMFPLFRSPDGNRVFLRVAITKVFPGLHRYHVEVTASPIAAGKSAWWKWSRTRLLPPFVRTPIGE